MTALANFRASARGSEPVERQHSVLPDTVQPGVSVTQLFPFQSYFDDALLERALLQQSKNSPIVNSQTPAVGAPTPMVVSNVPGYAIGLHPSSQLPVSVQPLVGGQATSPQPIILKPGQIFRPQGKPLAGVNGNFSGVNWGVPFGWLGGGVATLYIFSSPDADVAWPGNMELIFHRQRMQIVAPAALPANAPFNWPLRFPWTQALRGLENVDQSGQAVIGLEPTRVLMSLRLGALAAPAAMRILFQGTEDFDQNALGSVILTPVRFQNYIWGSYVATGGAGNLSTSFPVVEIAGPAFRLAIDGRSAVDAPGADDGGVQLVDMSGGTLEGQFVDVVRYGRL